MTLGLPLQRSSNPENDNNDFMNLVSAALDLSREAEEAYASAASSKLENSANCSKLGTTSMVTSAAQLTTGHQLNASGAGKAHHLDHGHPNMTSSASLTTDNLLTTSQQLTVGSQLTANNRVAQANSQDHSWVYFNHQRTSDTAINLACDSNDCVTRTKRPLHSNKQQHGVRSQRFASTNRKMSGNLSTYKLPRGMQTRHIAKIASGGTIEKGRATDLSILRKGLTTSNLSGNLYVHAKMSPEDTRHYSDVSAQTILSMGCHDDSILRLSNMATATRGRCHGFHGWSDVCFSDSTVAKISGVTPEIFDLLLSNLPTDLPGLPTHNCLLLFLMKLKLAMPFEFIAAVFGITTPTACNIFTHLLSILLGTLSDLIQWPLNTFTQTVNNQWRSIIKCDTVIDCLNIRTEEHSETGHHPEMFSNESGTNTVKIFVVLFPNGFICFISEAYVGSAKNADILANSELLNCLESTGTVLLLQNDKTLHQVLIAKGFRVLAPPFAPSETEQAAPGLNMCLDSDRDLKPLEGTVFPDLANDSEQTKGIPPAATISRSNVMEHQLPSTESVDSPHTRVESDSCNVHVYAGKLAQRLRSFSILTTTLEVTLLPYLDDVVRVCAALSNLQEPVT